MTIGELLKDRMFKARVVSITSWILVVLSIYLFKNEGGLGLLALIPSAAFFGSVLYVLYFVRCPKCDIRVGQAMSSYKKLNFCPNCGADFNSPT